MLGWPDFMGCYGGRTLALEVKTPHGIVTPLQARELAKWEEAGAVARVVRSVRDVQKLLTKIHVGCIDIHGD